MNLYDIHNQYLYFRFSFFGTFPVAVFSSSPACERRSYAVHRPWRFDNNRRATVDGFPLVSLKEVSSQSDKVWW